MNFNALFAAFAGCAIALFAGVAATLQPATAADATVWGRVAYDDAGCATMQPHRLDGNDFTFTNPGTDRAAARTCAFGDPVGFGYQGLNPKAAYQAKLGFFADKTRELRVTAGTCELGKVTVQPGKTVDVQFAIPAAAYTDGKLTLSIEKLSGPNAVVSEIEILSDHPQALAAPPAAWTDIEGRHISAHEGGISQFNGTYYWYGTSYRNNPRGAYGRAGRKVANGLQVYSSNDLLHWKAEGVCLPVPKSGPCSTGTLHRPSVIYNDKTKKYVMWFFHFDNKYPDVMLAVATADHPIGPFQIIGNRKSGEENGFAQDLGLFKDDDGKAYLVCDDGHRNLRVDLLADDYLDISGKGVIAIKAPPNCEGAAMIKWNGKYIVAGSGVNGWSPTDTHYAVADHPLGPYTAPRLINPVGTKTWGSQISNFFSDGKTAYVLCDRLFTGDNGSRINDLDASSYYFLPLRLDPATGEAKLDYDKRLTAAGGK